MSPLQSLGADKKLVITTIKKRQIAADIEFEALVLREAHWLNSQGLLSWLVGYVVIVAGGVILLGGAGLGIWFALLSVGLLLGRLRLSRAALAYTKGRETELTCD